MRITLSKSANVSISRPEDLIALDMAMQDLKALDELSEKIVVLKFFGGMSNPEVAEALSVEESISESTVKRRWDTARRWLHRNLRSRE